jgi:hypothetical protein
MFQGVRQQNSWFMHYATSLKVIRSSPDEVTDFFFQFTQSFRPHYALGFTQPLT